MDAHDLAQAVELAHRDQHEARIQSAEADAETVVVFWQELVEGGIPYELALELVRARFILTACTCQGYTEEQEE